MMQNYKGLSSVWSRTSLPLFEDSSLCRSQFLSLFALSSCLVSRAVGVRAGARVTAGTLVARSSPPSRKGRQEQQEEKKQEEAEEERSDERDCKHRSITSDAARESLARSSDPGIVSACEPKLPVSLVWIES